MFEIVTTVVTPADSYDLTDLVTVKDELNISTTDNDSFLTRAIRQASAAIYQYCNRVFAAEDLRDTIYPARDAYPYQVPGGVAPLQLGRWPIIAVDSVNLEETPGVQTLLTADTDYKVNPKPGQIIRLAPFTIYPTNWDPVTTTVLYSAGYATTPDDLVDAALRLVTARFKARGRDPALRSLGEPGLGQQTWWVGGPPMSGSMPQEIAGILDNYRVPVTA